MELEDKFLEALQVLKGIADSIKRDAQQKNNNKVQEQLKDLINGFKQELEKGNESRKELAEKLKETKEPVSQQLEQLKDKAINLAKENKIEWAVCKEFKPKHHKDSIKSTLDLLIDKAKNKVEQQERNNSKEKSKTIEPKEKTKTKTR